MPEDTDFAIALRRTVARREIIGGAILLVSGLVFTVTGLLLFSKADGLLVPGASMLVGGGPLLAHGVRGLKRADRDG